MGNDAESNFEINIKTSADTAGVRDVTSELKQLDGAVSYVTRGAQQLVTTHKEAAAAAEGHGHSVGTLRIAMRGANDAAFALSDFLNGDFVTAFHRGKFAVEDLGLAFNAAFPEAAMIVGITLGVELLSHLVTSLWEVKQTADDAKAAEKELADSIAAAAEKSIETMRALKDAYDEAAKSAHLLRQTQDELGDAGLAQKLAEVDERLAKGDLTPAQAMRQRSSLRAAGEQDKATREIAEGEANSKRIGSEMDYLALQKEQNHVLAKFREDMERKMAESAAFTTNTGGVNALLQQRADESRVAFEKQQAANPNLMNPRDIEKRSHELSEELLKQTTQIEVAKIHQRTDALKKASEEAEADKKENADGAKQRDEFEKATRDIRKRQLEEQKTALAAQLAEAQAKKDPESEHFGEQVEHIAALKKKLLDLSDEIAALTGAVDKNSAQMKREVIDYDAAKEVIKGEEKADKAEAAGAGRGGHSAGHGGHAMVLAPDGAPIAHGAWTGGAGIGHGTGAGIGRAYRGGGDRDGHIHGGSMVGEGTDFDDFGRFRIDTTPGKIDTSPGRIDVTPRSPSRRSTLPQDQQAAINAAGSARENQDILDPAMLGELRTTVAAITRHTGGSDSLPKLVGLMQEIAAAMEKNHRDHESMDREIDTLRSQIKNGRH